MLNVTSKSQKVRYEYYFLNIRQVTRYTCRKFEISHGGAHGGALRTFWCILMLKYRNIVFQSENSILEGMNSYSAPPHAPPHVVSWIFHIFYAIPILHWKDYTHITFFGCYRSHWTKYPKIIDFWYFGKIFEPALGLSDAQMAENGMRMHFYTNKHEY